jgi:general secretion pathway protein M
MIDKLNERERLSLLGGAVALVVILAGFGGFEVYRSTLTRLDKTIVTRTRQLADFDNLRRDALLLRQQIQQAEGQLAQSATFSLPTFIEGQAEQVAGRTSLAYARPQPPTSRGDLLEESLEAKLERLTLEQVLRLLWAVETGPVPMQVRDMELRKRFDDPAQLDLMLTVSAMRRSK